MANFIRSAKSGRDWSASELMAYNISVSSVPADEFFPNPDPSLDHIDQAILNYPVGFVDPNISDVAAEYLSDIDLATSVPYESLIDDFARETLKLLRYNERPTKILTHFPIPLTICGDGSRVAQTDVCLIHKAPFVLLVLVKDKTLFGTSKAEPQVIAEAIAAYQFNNDTRIERGHDALDAMTIPCITMSGTRPTFYLIPVTTELSNAVISGQYPVTQTQVLRCQTLPEDTTRAKTGMEDPIYRRLALKRFLAFKELARTHWMRVLEGF
jgi:hypothetical protein